MNRREFLATGVGALGASGAAYQGAGADASAPKSIRDLFPRLAHETYLNAAAATPLGAFAAAGLARYENVWRLGPGEGRGSVSDAAESARVRFARLIGAQPGEIALVHCTKAGEQTVLDGLPALRAGGNVVTDDLHFSGSLHNLLGLRRAGVDVRIVPAEDWAVDPGAIAAAMDDRTALVSVTFVSNVNGHVEPLAELAELAHARGAYLYADVIQAAGIVPIDVAALGVDFAACSAYKWLYGPHGVGFLFVREELQGTALADRVFPGYAHATYTPWLDGEEADEEFSYNPPADARRYQPGHVSYLGYAALDESLAFLEEVGVEKALAHSVALTERLRERVDPDRYPCISPHVGRSPIITFRPREPAGLAERLRAAGVTVSLGRGRLRVSPALYNDEGDVDRLVEVLNA